MIDCKTILLPNVFGGDVLQTELLYSVLEEVPKAEQYLLDARDISFVKPYGIIALLLSTRHLAARSKYPLQVKNIPPIIHAYLQRMDFFDACQTWLVTSDSPEDDWTRNAHTRNLLEITVISGPDDVATVAQRTLQVFSRWLRISNLNNLIFVISELCSNIYQHSGDQYGCVLIQKYESKVYGQVSVHLAVGDLGCGIRGSLMTRHSDLGQRPIDYLRAAMSGRTARQTGRGGLGLQRVEQIVKQQGGYLWIRSETAGLLLQNSSRIIPKISLPNLPGTQIALGFESPLQT